MPALAPRSPLLCALFAALSAGCSAAPVAPTDPPFTTSPDGSVDVPPSVDDALAPPADVTDRDAGPSVDDPPADVPGDVPRAGSTPACVERPAMRETGAEFPCPVERPIAGTELHRRCVEAPRGGCALPPGRYVPVVDGAAEVVWRPSSGRYLNEPTRARDATGRWHVFSNGANGVGGPWDETRILHGSAPTLRGPWTELPDVFRAGDPGVRERQFWAPFVERDGDGFHLLFYAFVDGEGVLRSARSSDGERWTRVPGDLPGGRDAMLLRLDDGRALLYSVGTVTQPDGPHDVVRLHESRAGSAWRELPPALTHPRRCVGSCWGFFESPFVIELGGSFYLFVTYTDSGRETYEQTAVFRASDPTRFAFEPVALLPAHGGEPHVEGERMVLTRGGWPDRITEARRGLSVLPISWALSEAVPRGR